MFGLTSDIDRLNEIREIVNEYLQIEMCEVGKTMLHDILEVLEPSCATLITKQKEGLEK